MGRKRKPRRGRKRKLHPEDCGEFRRHVKSLNGDQPGHIIVAGMHGASKIDKARIQALRVQTGASITSVSEHKYGLRMNGLDHVSCNFNCIRGAKSLAEAIKSKRARMCEYNDAIAKLVNAKFHLNIFTIIDAYLQKEPTIVVVLDYFWLEKDYYKTRYGMLWMSTHVNILLQAGATEVILPFDKRYEPNVPSNMEIMLKEYKQHQFKQSNVSISLIESNANPLWVSSDLEWLHQFQFDAPWTTRA